MKKWINIFSILAIMVMMLAVAVAPLACKTGPDEPGPVALVGSTWSSSGYEGDLAFLDSSGNVICVIESASREIVIPDGSQLNTSAAAGILNMATGEIGKADLADAIYYNEHIIISGAFDNQTVKSGPVPNDCTVTNVTYFTDAALGGSVGIDLVDGGTDGTGTDVINSCSDNLSGIDDNALGTPHTLSAGDHINVKCDDFTAETHCTVHVTLKVLLNATE